ncbi:hypothetical protein DFA_11213 [Cavenderia fasciculata]|uniref:Uncharacterized protein n=1 Tax=Cavenderia fasciculata TaxID=261658 RepID=F4QFE5_CACFS|nr:uncharacterized protein DFA_11213 [Cavenderia fasciculata]EGG13452.1 hypothetical protein DFA_11213 [Cavenderia fasciculata]|eukprot:XP_004350156.1 hypothetical protein DFA_11213 [Cavenderia fasciculata]
MSLSNLSNLLLSQIISDINNNGDIVCLLLTCKDICYNSSLKRSIRFKGIGPIDTIKGKESKKFNATSTLFKLSSFKDILENSISHQHVFKPHFIEKEKEGDGGKDNGSVTTALVHKFCCFGEEDIIKSLAIPSIETLFIEKTFYDVNLNSVSVLPRLQHLSMNAKDLTLGHHSETLKSLQLQVNTPYRLADLGLTKFVCLTELTFVNNFVSQIGPGLLPSSLTSLTLPLIGIIPRNTFLSLKSLKTLKIHYEIEKVREQQRFIDLESLPVLKMLSICDKNDPTIDKSTLSRCPMPQLEKLCIEQSEFILGRVNLGSCPSIKKLFVFNCLVSMPNIIPSTVEKLTIIKTCFENTILEQVVLPPLLTCLTLTRQCAEEVKLPESLIKLKQYVEKVPLSLPQNLKKLLLTTYRKNYFENFELPSQYPPNLESLDLSSIPGIYKLDIPPMTKYLSIIVDRDYDETQLSFEKMVIDNTPPIFSIGSRIRNSISQPQWLPPTTTHLDCLIKAMGHKNGVRFRLDERLDPYNRNVLVLETQTLQGGIISQRKSSTNDQQQQQQQQYDPIYLHFTVDKDSSPYRLNLSFGDNNLKHIMNQPF